MDDYGTAKESALMYGLGGEGPIRVNKIPTLRARLEYQRKELQERIGKIDSIILLLDKNPAIEEFQDLMTKLGGV